MSDAGVDIMYYENSF